MSLALHSETVRGEAKSISTYYSFNYVFKEVLQQSSNLLPNSWFTNKRKIKKEMVKIRAAEVEISSVFCP